MKHLIETAGPSGLTRVDYNRIILDSETDDIIVRGGILMVIPTLTSVSQAVHCGQQ